MGIPLAHIRTVVWPQAGEAPPGQPGEVKMKYRKLSPTGDYTFGKNSGNFFVDNPEAVAQAVRTRLQLAQGEWFLDITEGTPYSSKILGAGKASTYDAAIQDVISGTQGVKKIVAYASGVNPDTREAFVSCIIDTIYGTTNLQVAL